MDITNKKEIGKLATASLYADRGNSWWDWLKAKGFTDKHIVIGEDDV